MIYYVFFTLDGIPGRETFRSEQPLLHGYADARDQFWELAAQLGARRIIPPSSAWQPVAFVEGPTLLAIERVTTL